MAVLAHLTGAGGLVDGLFHPIAGVDHLLAIVGVGVVAGLLRNRLAWWALPASFVGAMALGGVLGMTDVVSSTPSVETAIAFSVVVVGLAIAAGRRLEAWTLPGLVMVAGSLHGLAHGSEVPASSNPVLYGVGFLAATALLHIAGAGVGIAVDRRRVLELGTGLAIGTGGLLLVSGVI